jgi:hypothetical protein
MPKAKAAIKSSKPRRPQRPTSRKWEQFYAKKHILFKVYDEDAELSEKLATLCDFTSLCTFVFRYYYYNYSAQLAKAAPGETPELQDRPLKEACLLEIPKPLEIKTQALASQAGLTWDEYLTKLLTAYLLKKNRKAFKQKVIRGKRKNHSSRRWDKHFLIRVVNFNLYNDDAIHAAELDNLTGFSNVCLSYMRVYYHTLAQFYANNTKGYIPSIMNTDEPINLALANLDPQLWDAYVTFAQLNAASDGKPKSAEEWMVYAIKRMHGQD